MSGSIANFKIALLALIITYAIYLCLTIARTLAILRHRRDQDRERHDSSPKRSDDDWKF